MLTFNNQTTQKIVDFIIKIGISVHKEMINEKTFLPGILVKNGGLVVDEDKLCYPGDLLHEAGHLATLLPEKRATVYNDVSKNAGNEIVTIVWSYAAAIHLDINPHVVFHDNGYKGDSKWLVEHYQGGGEMGIPLVEWMNLAYSKERAYKENEEPFPVMQQWLRA
ncbi:MAG: hypothetical protein Q7S59_09080 [Sulfurimonas sp.]|nr:hypothetical protein [Sulfurimonas sp.]